MPERELAICQRLLDFRLSKKLSRTAFAREAGITPSRLNNYERAAAPLPYSVAAKVCGAFFLSQEWLANRNGDITNYVVVSPEHEAKIPARMLFSAAFDEYICPWLAAQSQEPSPWLAAALPKLGRAGIQVDLLRSAGALSSPGIRASLAGVFKSVMDTLPAHLVWLYYRHLLSASNRFEDQHAAEVKKKCKPTVDTLLTDVRLAGVNSETGYWKALVRQVRVKTSAPGAKAQLARDLDTTRQAVNKWLSGQGAPSAEITLRLLKWVEGPAQKLNAPGASIKTAKGKTQIRRSSHEHKTQVHKRR